MEMSGHYADEKMGIVSFDSECSLGFRRTPNVIGLDNTYQMPLATRKLLDTGKSLS